MEMMEREIKTTLVKPAAMKAPGTCGELVQGYIDGQDFLINCPIDLYAQAQVRPAVSPGIALRDARRFCKIRDAIALVAQEHSIPLAHEVEVDSDIPRGKGMASSSADITAALAAVCRSSGVTIPDAQMARIITEIEPSDCVHFAGIAHVNHLTGELFALLPAPSNLRVLIFDCGGEIDTIGFDRQRARQLYRDRTDDICRAVSTLKQGLYSGNLQDVAEAATLSATLSQHIHCKPQFDDLLAATKEVGALGVNCAHSGSVLGVLYRSSEMLKEHLQLRIDTALGSSVQFVGDFAVIGGGYHAL